MAGYDGFSMSNNARIAYANGELPKSKWTKTMIIEQLDKSYGKEIAAMAKKHSTDFLRKHFLSRSSWHHTSEYYNKTEFYEFDGYYDSDVVLQTLSLTEEKIAQSVWRPCDAFWTEWTGTRKHPHGETVSAFGRTDGKTFLSANGRTTKKVNGNYFHYCIPSDKQAKEMFKKEFALKTSHRYKKWLETGKIN